MPWTLSHPAAVLPLRRLTPQPLDFPALVIGSMTPDIGYYIDRFDLAKFAHTLPGSVFACLPTGLIMLVIFYFFARPVCHALPFPHRQALLPRCPDFPTSPISWSLILLSLLLGAWTHNFWDAFTHESGWFVERIPWLQQPVMQIGAITVHMYLLLQELSTLIGFAILLLAYAVWVRRHPVDSAADSQNDGWRYLFWIGIIGLSFLIALPAAFHYASSTTLHGFLFGRSFLFRTALYSSGVAVPSILLGAGLIYVRRTVPESGSGRTSDPSQP